MLLIKDVQDMPGRKQGQKFICNIMGLPELGTDRRVGILGNGFSPFPVLYACGQPPRQGALNSHDPGVRGYSL